MRRLTTGLVALSSLLAAGLGCSSTSEEVRGDPAAPPAAWMQVALQVTGPAAEKDKYERCAKVAYETGIAITGQAQVRAIMTLSDGGNRLTIVRDGQTVRDEALPKWGMTSLCANAFAAAAEAAGFAVQVSRVEPGPECNMRGAVEGNAGGEWFQMPSYDAALADMRLQASRGGMNYIVVDAMRQLGNARLVLNGRGYVCSGPPAAPALAPPPTAPSGPPCVPDCSPGYACVSGKCVSACNPPCAGKQQCGPDRMCH